MKKRILIIAHTYYQMIVAMQLRYTIYNHDEVTLILSDYSKGIRKVCDKLFDMHVFEDCHSIEIRPILHERGTIKKIKDMIGIGLLSTNDFRKELDGISNLYFDEFICYNYRIDTFGIYSILSEYNENIIMSFMEEGILSYGAILEDTKARNLVCLMRRIRRKRNILDAIGYAYCFHPELYNGIFKAKEIPAISLDGNCANALKELFGTKEIISQYNYRYIFFSSVYDFEGGEAIGEFELVEKIAGVVGKENIIVKEHPRDTRGIYKKNGYEVDRNSAIPWEAIQLSGDFSEKIFLTATSGSVLAGSFLSEKPIKTFYLYKLCDLSGNKSAQATTDEISSLIYEKKFANIRIVDSIGEILQ